MSRAGWGWAARSQLYFGFFLTGVVTVLLGPLMPELRDRWQVEPAQAGALFVAQFAASSLGAVVSSFDLRRSLVVGYALMAASLAALSWVGWSLAPLVMAGVGLGLGLTIPATNLQVAHVDPSSRAATLSTLNLIWGVGAMACPLFVAALVGPDGDRLFLLLLAGCVGLVGLALAGTSSWPPTGAEADGRRLFTVGPGGWTTLLLIAFMLFLYVGVEAAIGGWVVTFADQLVGERATESLLIGSGFWASLMAGRAVAPLLLRVSSEIHLFFGSLVVAGVGAGCIVLAGGPAYVAAGSLVTGLGLAAVFPLIVSQLTAETAASGSRGTGWVFAFAGFGGAAIPWLTAQAARTGGSLRGGFLVPIAGLVMIVILLGLHRWRALRRAPNGSRRGARIIGSPGEIS